MDAALLWFYPLWAGARSFLSLFGFGVITIGGVVGAAYLVFRSLGEKWINQKFAEQLESYKAEQTRELERLRHRINSVFDRAKRLHDREFEILPDLWARLTEAKRWAGGYLSVYQEYPNIRSLSDAALSEFLSTTPFSDQQKREIANSSNRQKVYVKTYELYRAADVMDKLRDASAALSRNVIFVQSPLRENFEKMISYIHMAVIEQKINLENDVSPRMREAIDKLDSEGEQLYATIREAVAERLWDATKAEL